MAPQITAWDQLPWVFEQVDQDTGDFKHTMFAMVQDDMVYYGQINEPKAGISLQQASECLSRLGDEDIFPKWSPDLALTESCDGISSKVFIKRPRIELFGIFQEHQASHHLGEALLEEAETMEMLRSHPHPNIVRYHGCRVRRGHVTGLVIDRHPHELECYLKAGYTLPDNKLFMNSLQSAIDHLHSLGWAHNDLNPTNILVSEDKRPILIDFGSAQIFGKSLTLSRGTEGWIDCEMKDYTTSDARHDTFALNKLRTWLENPTFED